MIAQPYLPKIVHRESSSNYAEIARDATTSIRPITAASTGGICREEAPDPLLDPEVVLGPAPLLVVEPPPEFTEELIEKSAMDFLTRNEWIRAFRTP